MKTMKTQVLCEQCCRETNHDVVHEYHMSLSNECFWQANYQIVKCCGCGSVSFKIEVLTDEDDYNPDTGELEPSVTLYPPRITGRKPLEDDSKFPPAIQKIYYEVLNALNNSLVILAAIGLRTLIECICIDQNVRGANLEKKINALASTEVLSETQAKLLHTHRFLGNIATHEITAAKQTELVAALDIVETLLKTIYILPEMDKNIRTGKK